MIFLKLISKPHHEIEKAEAVIIYSAQGTNQILSAQERVPITDS